MATSNFKQMKGYDSNPFKIEGINNRIITTKEDQQVVADTATGELYVQTKIPKTMERRHDAAVYTKVFRGGLTRRMRNLSTPAINLFFLILERLDIGAQKICLTEEDYLLAYEYKPGSKRLYYASVLELEEREIIAKVNGSTRCYWININVMFNGDRTKLPSPEEH